MVKTDVKPQEGIQDHKITPNELPTATSISPSPENVCKKPAEQVNDSKTPEELTTIKSGGNNNEVKPVASSGSQKNETSNPESKQNKQGKGDAKKIEQKSDTKQTQSSKTEPKKTEQKKPDKGNNKQLQQSKAKENKADSKKPNPSKTETTVAEVKLDDLNNPDGKLVEKPKTNEKQPQSPKVQAKQPQSPKPPSKQPENAQQKQGKSAKPSVKQSEPLKAQDNNKFESEESQSEFNKSEGKQPEQKRDSKLTKPDAKQPQSAKPNKDTEKTASQKADQEKVISQKPDNKPITKMKPDNKATQKTSPEKQAPKQKPAAQRTSQENNEPVKHDNKQGLKGKPVEKSADQNSPLEEVQADATDKQQTSPGEPDIKKTAEQTKVEPSKAAESEQGVNISSCNKPTKPDSPEIKIPVKDTPQSHEMSLTTVGLIPLENKQDVSGVVPPGKPDAIKDSAPSVPVKQGKASSPLPTKEILPLATQNKQVPPENQNRQGTAEVIQPSNPIALSESTVVGPPGTTPVPTEPPKPDPAVPDTKESVNDNTKQAPALSSEIKPVSKIDSAKVKPQKTYAMATETAKIPSPCVPAENTNAPSDPENKKSEVKIAPENPQVSSSDREQHQSPPLSK